MAGVVLMSAPNVAIRELYDRSTSIIETSPILIAAELHNFFLQSNRSAVIAREKRLIHDMSNIYSPQAVAKSLLQSIAYVEKDTSYPKREKVKYSDEDTISTARPIHNKHSGRAGCKRMETKYKVIPHVSWGDLPPELQKVWNNEMCNDHFSVPDLALASASIPMCPKSIGGKRSSKKLIAVVLGTTTRGVHNPSPTNMALFRTLLPSLVRSLDCEFRYIVVLGYDIGDQYYDSNAGMTELLSWYEEHVRNVMINNGIEMNLITVGVNNPGDQPGPATLAAARAAYNLNADYFYRINDDTEMATRWPNLLVSALKTLPDEIGVVGPVCKQGHQGILTHNFVSRVHMHIFSQLYYPVVFTNWYADDWISFVYGESRTLRVMQVEVIHHMTHGQRYKANTSHSFLVKNEVLSGRKLIHDWLSSGNRKLSSSLKSFDADKFQTTCCSMPIRGYDSH